MAACSTPATPATTQIAPPSATPSEDPEAQILSAVHGFYEALTLISHGDVDPAHFDGVATGAIIEREVAQGRYSAEIGEVYIGEPTLSDITIEVDGASAEIFVCVDNTTWHPDDVDLGDEVLVLSGGLLAERVDGDWLITDYAEIPETFTC